MSMRYPGGLIAPTPVNQQYPSGVWTGAQTTPYQTNNVWANDSSFKNTTMLLHGDGTNGSQNNTFLDSSGNSYPITRAGNATQGTFSPYGSNWSNYFDGSSFETVAGSTNLAFGTGDFTIECWINFSSVASGNWLDMRPTTTNGLYPNLYVSSGTLAYFVNSSDRITGGTVVVGTWYHIAVCRSATSTKLFLDGTQVGSTYTDSNNYICGTNRPMIGGNGYTNAANFNAYISNFRFVKGTALYTTTFTPSTIPLTAITNTSLLICQSNRFVDNSASPYAITTSGSPSVQRFSPFSPTTAYSTSVIGGSGYFDGSSANIITTNTITTVGTQDFCLEAWVYCFSTTDYACIIGNDTAGGGAGWFIEMGSTRGIFIAGPEVSLGSAQYNRWFHVVFCRVSNTYGGFVNGVRQATGSLTTNYSTPVKIGINSYVVGTLNKGTTGYIADGRVTIGSSPYSPSSTTLTVPTAPLTAVTGTVYLASMTNAGILDNAMMNDLQTVGNAQISTSVVKYGTGSLAFDGTGDYLTVPASPNFIFGTGDFTVEFWVQEVTSWNPAGGSNYAHWISLNSYTTGIMIRPNLTGTAVEVWVGNTQYSFTTTLSLGIWYHIAVTRSSSSMRFFVNGTQIGSTQTVSYNISTNTANTIGSAVHSTTEVMQGYIDDLRITKGVARYITNFTPPVARMPNQ